MLGNVAEFGTANVFMAKDGVVYTPAANGTFLNGITRHAGDRSIAPMPARPWSRRSLRYADFQDADEIFSTGNFTKVVADHADRRQILQPGPFYRRARELYWEYAHGGGTKTAI